MADRKYDRRFDVGSTFPLRTSTNEPTRSMGSLATPVLMKSSSSKNLEDEASEKRRRENMSHQLRVPSLPSKGMFLGLSKSATASELPTITGKKPLPKALLPKEARKNSYQPVISGPFAFTSGLNVTTGPAYGMQRRSSISGCYPLRPSANASRSGRVPNGTDTESRSTEGTDDSLRLLSQDRARRNSVNTLSPPPTEGTSQVSLFRNGGGRAVGRQDVDTESIYPMLRVALGKDANDEDYSVIRRNSPARQNVEKKERPVSYADPYSFHKMHEDLQTPYAAYPPSYNPPSEPTKTSLDADAVVISESSSTDKTPNLQSTDFENTSDSIPLPNSTRKSVTTASEDQTCKVSSLSEEVKPQSQAGQTMKLEALSPSTTGLKLQTSVSTRVDEISQYATEPEIRSPVTENIKPISPKTTKPKIQHLATIKPEAIPTNKAGSNREEWYSPIPASPRRVIKSPRFSCGSQETAEFLSPAYTGTSTKFTDSSFEHTQKPGSAFSFEIGTSSPSANYSTKHDDSQVDTDYPEADQNLITKENNNSPPALPSSAPPPLPITSPPTGAPIITPSGQRHNQEYSSSSNTVPENYSNKPISDSTTVETDPPALPSSAPPPLPVTLPPTGAAIIPPSEPLHKDLEYNSSSDKILENSSLKLKSDGTTIETAQPALPSSPPPPLPANPPTADAPSIHTSGLHHKDLEHNSSADTILDNCFSEAATRSEYGTTTERSTDDMEQSERQSLSSEESLLDGHETKSSAGRNRETLSPTLSDADSGIDSVKLEQKRHCETGLANEEYQRVLWDEQSETKSDVAVSQFSCEPNITDTPFTDASESSITPASLELQQTIHSDCVLSPPGLLPTQIETRSDVSKESTSFKAIPFDKETDRESMHQSHNRAAKIAFSEADKTAGFDDLPPTPNPPAETQILTVPNELPDKSDTTSVGQTKLTTVHIRKGVMGLGFSVQGGKGSAYGDKPVTVKKIFKAGDSSVKEMLSVGDEIISANGKDLNSCSLHEAWNYMKTLPDGTLDLVIRRSSDI